ncbi:uncharacterized protein LOC131947344 [Physella acuta]|uniref:uncharacterized protein LOC131947344 n=1 Tax=Physella acuta TaxID=109671 RepID=UPI0027DADB71|nr:uncharacterized protein LOC131947344 [Physella acuta]XP_059164522.1 uncharacterized protein LOC131947344 [Physella acuta]XP_059164523.1 uncharacterized protein LOC131947344 [Physella acuta]
MAECNPIKEHLKFLLEQLEKMHLYLQSNLNDLVQKVRHETTEWIENRSESSLNFKDVVAMVTSANTSVLEHIQMLSGFSIGKQQIITGYKTPTKRLSVYTTQDDKNTETHDEVDNNVDFRHNLQKRIRLIEKALSSTENAQNTTENVMSDIKKWKDNLVTEQNEIRKKVEEISSTQNDSFKKLQKQINEQKNTCHQLGKEFESITEIKQWKENCVSHQSSIGAKVEQLSKKQKQHFKNIKKQAQEGESNIAEMRKEVDCLKEKELKVIKRLDTFDIILNKINKEIKSHADNTDQLAQRVKRLDVVSAGPKDGNIHLYVMFQLLHKRLMPIEKLIDIFNQNSKHRANNQQKIETLEGDVLKVSNEMRTTRQEIKSHFSLLSTLQEAWKKNVATTSNTLQILTTKIAGQGNVVSRTAETCVYKRYACHIQLEYTTAVTSDSIISKFGEVHEYNGQHLNQTTGKFVSPHDGLYLVGVTLHEWEKKLIEVVVCVEDTECESIEVKYANTSAAGSVVVDMKEGQELYFYVATADYDAKLSWFSSFTIVSL